MLLAKVIQKVTGRDYAIEASDLTYLLAKGGVPFVRGALWSVVRLRAPRGLLLGPHIQFVQSGRLRNARGVAIGGFSYVDCSAEGGIVIGPRSTIRERAWIQGRSGLNARAARLQIGARCYIGPNAVIGLGGPVTIGDDVQIGAGLTITAEAHEPGADGSFVTGAVSRRGVAIGDRCWLGNNVNILDGVEIGEGSVIGAGSIVTRSIPSRSLAFGAPAKVVRSLERE
ncbi:acyltransferase [Sphingosinithalassobacter sp. LHW66-3]|uniref:acyltransferase n=1 Tax=Sphingosinithalassobacter sp. LHW66-3 TaxID=3424718 RepID=UPI003D6A6615